MNDKQKEYIKKLKNKVDISNKTITKIKRLKKLSDNEKEKMIEKEEEIKNGCYYCLQMYKLINNINEY